MKQGNFRSICDQNIRVELKMKPSHPVMVTATSMYLVEGDSSIVVPGNRSWEDFFCDSQRVHLAHTRTCIHIHLQLPV